MYFIVSLNMVLGLFDNSLEQLCKLTNNLLHSEKQMSHDMAKPTKWVCAQQRLRSAWASTQSDQSSLCAQWVAKDPSFLHADSEDSDQAGRMPRLIWIFAGRMAILLVLSCRGSNHSLEAWEITKQHFMMYITLIFPSASFPWHSTV